MAIEPWLRPIIVTTPLVGFTSGSHSALYNSSVKPTQQKCYNIFVVCNLLSSVYIMYGIRVPDAIIDLFMEYNYLG